LLFNSYLDTVDNTKMESIWGFDAV